MTQVSVRRHDHTAFALEGLDQEPHRVLGDGVVERIGVAVRNQHKTRCKRAKSLTVLVLGTEADDGGRSPVEVVFTDDDLSFTLGHALHLVTPFADRLDRCLDGFGARVHRKGFFVPGRLTEVAHKGPHLIVVKRP